MLSRSLRRRKDERVFIDCAAWRLRMNIFREGRAGGRERTFSIGKSSTGFNSYEIKIQQRGKFDSQIYVPWSMLKDVEGF